VRCSSVEAPGLETGKSVDGFISTRWSLEFSDRQCLTVDRGGPVVIRRVVLSWEVAYARRYRLQISDDGMTWVTIHEEPDGDGGLDEIVTSATGRSTAPVSPSTVGSS
jgi:hypothetical protein